MKELVDIAVTVCDGKVTQVSVAGGGESEGTCSLMSLHIVYSYVVYTVKDTHRLKLFCKSARSNG